MCDDSEAVAMFVENENDEIEHAPKLNKSYEACPIASSTISASVKATNSAQALAAMPDGMYWREGQHLTMPPCRSSFLSPGLGHIIQPKSYPLDSRAVVNGLLCNFHYLLRLLFCTDLQSSTRKSNKDTFNSHVQLTKDAALRQDTTWIDEIEILSEEDSPPSRIQKLKDKIKRGKRTAVKFKPIDEIEFELAVLNRKLADAESDVKYVQTGFAQMMTIMETLVSEMKELKADFAMQAERCKGQLFPCYCIPDKIPHFIGRQKECQVILDHLTNRDTRLVDVWGPPGFGKTSVAINVAHHLRAMEIPVYLISLRGIKNKYELVSKLFSKFAVSTKTKSHHISATNWLIHCLQQLRNRHVLILDNADDLLESGDAELRDEVLRFTETILTQCSYIKLLFTTRESLDYLSHKIPIHNERVGVLDEVSSMNLVQSLLPNVSGDDCSSIIKICGQVPLAMRLMCSILREENAQLDELLEELTSVPLVQVLDNASFSDDARLKRMIDKSFQRLTDQEKLAFVSLAVFQGCFKMADATTVLHLTTDRTTKKILRSLERKSFIESYVTDSETAFRVHPLLRGFVDEKKRTDQRIRASFYFAKLRFYYLKIKRFAKAFIKLLTGRLAEAYYWKKGSLSSLFNDKLYRRVVEALSRAKLFLYAAWRNFRYGRCTDTADCPVKIQCYHGIRQILSGDLDKGISSLLGCVDRLSIRGDQTFLKVLGYEALAHAYQRKGQEELASHFQYLCSSEVQGTSGNAGLCIAPKIFNNCHDRSPLVKDASGHGQRCREQRSGCDLCCIPEAAIFRKSPDTVETRRTTHEGEGRPLPMVKEHEEKTAEEQAFTVPFSSDQDRLRPQVCDSKDAAVQLQENLQLEKASLENPQPDTKDLKTSEGQALTLPFSVEAALLSKSCDAQEVVNRLQEELQKRQCSLEHSDPETKRMIRCLARKAKCSSRHDVVKRLREVTTAGTTGPLLSENLDVGRIPLEQIRDLSVNLCGGDEWKMVADKLGLTLAEIRFLDRRSFNPFGEALSGTWNKRCWTVGQLYDILVDCEFPMLADLL